METIYLDDFLDDGIIKEKSYDKSYCFIEALLSLKNVKRFGKKFGDLQTIVEK